MKRISFLLGTLLIVSMVLAACGGEQTSTTVPGTNVPPITAESTMTEDGTALTGTPDGTDTTTTPGVPVTGVDSTSRVSNLLDYDIWNQNGEQIGEVEDMVLDLDNSNVSYVVIETGGFLDLGDKTLLVPWNMLELQTPVSGGTENAFVILADAEMLNNAPDIDFLSVLPESGQPANDWDTDIRSFWESGVVPSATDAPTEAATEAATEAPTEAVTGAATAAPGAGIGKGQGAELQGVMLASDLLGATITFGKGLGTGSGTGTTGTTQATAEATSTVDAAASPVASPEASPAATLSTGTGSSGTGTGTTEAPTESTVEDIIIDPDTGDILFLVLSSLFDGEDRWIPVPLSTLNWDMTNQGFLFVADSNLLSSAPFFLPDAFPDTTMDGWDTEFNDFWQNNGGTGTGANATATP